MTTNVNVGRQTVLVAERELDFDDLTAGTAVPVIYLKPGCRILRGWTDVTEAFSIGTANIGDTYGDTPDEDKYGAAVDLTAAGVALMAGAGIPGTILDTAEAITVTLTGAPTAGKVRVAVEYVEDERTTEVHTYRG